MIKLLSPKWMTRMADLDEQLEDWYKKVEKTVNLTSEQRSEITGAGARIFSESLKSSTPVSSENYSSGRSVGHNNRFHGKKPRKTKHLRDSITYKSGYTADKLKSGDTSVGFENPYQAMVARFVNNGTAGMSQKEIKNMHFIENAQEKSKDAVLRAEARKYKEMIEHDFGR